ncbi:hypothetical protein U9M48_020160, partial [Paspalum notatum var. saurae]
ALFTLDGDEDDSSLRRRAILAAAPSFRNHKRVGEHHQLDILAGRTRAATTIVRDPQTSSPDQLPQQEELSAALCFCFFPDQIVTMSWVHFVSALMLLRSSSCYESSFSPFISSIALYTVIVYEALRNRLAHREKFEIKLMIAEIIGVLERLDDILGVWSSFEHDLLLYIWVLSNTSRIKIKLPSTYMEAHASYSILQG